MKPKPLIGVVAGQIQNKIIPWYPTAYGQPHTYTDAIIRAGGIPVIVPLTANKAVIDDLYSRLDGIMFAGGNDIQPKLYHEAMHETNEGVSEIRDNMEMRLVRVALADQKPVLGICRGMQLLNVAQGGTLYQHIPLDLDGERNHRQASEVLDLAQIAHSLSIDEDSKLAAMVGKRPIRTNSNHHQAVKELGRRLRAVAWSEDGVIEAIELPGEAFACGIQSHPEAIEAVVEPRWQKLFEAFVTASQTSHGSRMAFDELVIASAE